MMIHELAPDDPAVLTGEPLAGPNQWPADLPGFQATVMAYNLSLIHIFQIQMEREKLGHKPILSLLSRLIFQH